MKKINQEAHKIILQNKVKEVGWGNSRAFFEVATVPIELRYCIGEDRVFICTCKHCSIHEDKETECSYKIALREYLKLPKERKGSELFAKIKNEG